MMIKDFQTRYDETSVNNGFKHIKDCEKLINEVFQKHQVDIYCPEKIAEIFYFSWSSNVWPLGKKITQTSKEFLKAYKEFIDLQEIEGEEIRIRITQGKTGQRKALFAKEGYIARALIQELAEHAEYFFDRWDNPINATKKGRPASFQEPAIELYNFLNANLSGEDKARQAYLIIIEVFDLMGFEFLITNPKGQDATQRKKDALRKLISRAKKGSD